MDLVLGLLTTASIGLPIFKGTNHPTIGTYSATGDGGQTLFTYLGETFNDLARVCHYDRQLLPMDKAV